MRKPGFVFVELYTQRLDEYASFFQKVCALRLVREEGGFSELRSATAMVLLNADKELPQGHPFQDRLVGSNQGIGVEIGIVVNDLAAARKTALQFSGWTVSDIRHQEWGLTDFRVITPDGYYLRLTDPPADE
jgi:catechol 2,3-dioxygenase-like lactoylglutathione lyase family enzyme